jgi:hypothetical protein
VSLNVGPINGPARTRVALEKWRIRRRRAAAERRDADRSARQGQAQSAELA